MRKLGRALDRLFAFLDSETVRGFQVLQYLCYFFGGLAMLLTGTTPSNVDMALGSFFDTTWKLLAMLGPMLFIAGVSLRGRLTYMGMWWQLAGDAAILGSLAVYLISLVQSPTLTPSHYVVAVFVGLLVCTSLLLVRDLRRIGENEIITRRT